VHCISPYRYGDLLLLSAIYLSINISAAHQKEHLPIVAVRQKEKSQDRRKRNFVVERLAVQLEKRRVDLDVISTSVTSNTLHLSHP